LKPVLHIIGLGTDRLDKLSLEIYRLLKDSEVIFVRSLGHPVVRDMIKEGFSCLELCPDIGEKNADREWNLTVERMAKIINYSQIKRQAVLALPGNPLGEGKVVRTFQQLLSERYDVDLSLLLEDSSLARLTGIMAELRSRRGCPWDKEQTHTTLRKYLIEETYEVIEAIDMQDTNNFREELGDLLLQVVFHSQIAEEADNFSLSDVIKGICDKLVRRHPHVFDSLHIASSEEVLVNWDAIKKREKLVANKAESGVKDFFDIPKGLPALQMAEKVQKKASKVGFDWGNYQGPLAKIYEELAELEKEIEAGQRTELELGDLLFSVVNLSRFLEVNAEESLRRGTKKFQGRFNEMVIKIRDEGLTLEGLTLKEMDYYWNKVKNEENMVL
jgi:tetrapyrrole methylase family protein/MazG family protein